MAEYIEREGLMKELGPYKENNFSQEMSVILQIVAGRPAADVAPVVHGHWKFDHMTGERSYIATCSECGGGKFFSKKEDEPPYCERCGALMDGEDGDG